MGLIPTGMPQYYGVPWGMYPANLIPQQSSQPPPRRPLTPSQQAGENQPPYQVCMPIALLFVSYIQLSILMRRLTVPFICKCNTRNIFNKLYVAFHLDLSYVKIVAKHTILKICENEYTGFNQKFDHCIFISNLLVRCSIETKQSVHRDKI